MDIFQRARVYKTMFRAWGLSDPEVETFLTLPRVTLRELYSIHATLSALFVNPDDEARWLREPLPILDNLSPLEDMLQNGMVGVTRVEALTERMANRN